jgi:CHAT domain-containing protein/Tfp pilus assembly protein PilF
MTSFHRLNIRLVAALFCGASCLVVWPLQSLAHEQGSASSPKKAEARASGGQTEKTAAKRLVTKLALRKPVERELKGGGADTYEFKVSKDQFLRVVAEQNGIDLVLALVDPSGKVVVEADSPNGAWGPEPASLIAESSGIYRAQVKSLDKNAAAGKYTLTITDLRKPTAEDGARIAAERALFAAALLSAQSGAEALPKAMEFYEKASSQWHAVHDAYEEALCLKAIGDLRGGAGGTDNFRQALEYYGRALEIVRAAKAQRNEAEILQSMGKMNDSLGEKQKALEYFNQALAVERARGDRVGEAATLNSVGSLYDDLGERQKALEYFNQSLPLERAVGDRIGEAVALGDIGLVYAHMGEERKALEYYNQALAVERSAGDRLGEAAILNDIGRVYDDLGEKEKALEYFKQSLPIRREFNDREGEAAALNNMGLVYDDLGEKQKALEYFGQVLTLLRAVGDRRDEAVTLNNIGSIYDDLGEKQKALEYYNQSLPVRRAVGDRNGEAATLNNMGLVYDDLGEKQKALEYFNQAVLLLHAVGDRRGEAVCLGDIGLVYAHLGENQKALEYYSRALPIERAVGDRSGEAATLHNMGKMYADLGEKQKALDNYTEALGLYRALQDPLREGKILDTLMSYWSKEKNTSLAIFFGKQSVNAIQQIRKNIQGLDKGLQKSFLESKANTYRDLGDLLITQGRLSEAQQVLDLLKEQEYFEFVRGNENLMDAKSKPISLNPEEQSSREAYEKIAGQITAAGVEYSELRAKKSRTPEEEAHLAGLKEKLTVANQEMGRFFKTLYVEFGKNAQANQIAENVREQAGGMQSIVRELGPGTVALYTLVGESRYSVIVITASTMQAREYPIAAADLRRKVAALLEALKNPASDPLPASQELYKILVAPMANDLKGARAQTLMWSLNDVLRYVPMAALHDGKQYLLESYRNVVITPASIARLKDKVDVGNSSIAAMGVSKDYDGLGPLPAVPGELEHIVRDEKSRGASAVLPGTLMLDDDFTESEMAKALDKHYPVVHIASHFVLQAGNETNSYLLLGGKDVGGKGYHLTLAEVRDDPTLTFDGTELLTLSACQTGTSGTALNGREVDGLGITAQQKGAKAVLASLWSVADESTALLMADFYKQWLGTPGITKVGALRQAQLNMLHGASNGIDAGAAPARETENGANKKQKQSYIHPFYWGGFILIGNWK